MASSLDHWVLTDLALGMYLSVGPKALTDASNSSQSPNGLYPSVASAHEV